MNAYNRPFLGKLLNRLDEQPRFLQILIGPRQVGKTFAAKQAERKVQDAGKIAIYVTADQLEPANPAWLKERWENARQAGAHLLIVDEIQKVSRWSEVVKMLWDEDRLAGRPMHVWLLGSSSLNIQRGLTESLAGRFELIRCGHWSWRECEKQFGWDFEQWLRFGGYPGAAEWIADETRWRAYIRDSMIETVLTRDVLNLRTITKPALLRQLFNLVCQAPAQIVSYEKMLGQLTDAGNTTTLAHYLQVLAQSFLCGGLSKFSRGVTRSKGSSPKLVIFNNALVTALNPTQQPPSPRLPSAEQAERAAGWAAWRGRLVENAVGAALVDVAAEENWTVTYWRERDHEVDFILETSTELFAIEVKSGQPAASAGLKLFSHRYPDSLPVILGSAGLSFEKFFKLDAASMRIDLLRCGLSAKLNAPVEVSDDFGLVCFQNKINGKSGSYERQELDGRRILARLQN